jgi:uncharacterized Rossmann fold enzyme
VPEAESKESDGSQASEHSHSSIDIDMTAAELKDFLYEKLVEKKKVNVHGKAPSMNDLRSLFSLVKHVTAADDEFKKTASRTILTRFDNSFAMQE